MADPTDSPPSNATLQEWFYPVDGHNVWPFIQGTGPDPRLLALKSTGLWDASSSNQLGVDDYMDYEPVVISSPYTSGPGGGCMLQGHYKLVNNALNDPWDQPANPTKSSPKLPGNSTCKTAEDTHSCLVCTIAEPCLYDVWKDSGETTDLAATMPDVLKALNATYTKLVFEMRKPELLNFTQQNGWDCNLNASKSSLRTNRARYWRESAVVTTCAAVAKDTCWRTTGHTVRTIKNSSSVADCCNSCSSTTGCATYSFEIESKLCWLLSAGAKVKKSKKGCESGTLSPSPSPSPPAPSPPPPPSPPGPPNPCSGHWGCYIGPSCYCPAGVGKCNTT